MKRNEGLTIMRETVQSLKDSYEVLEKLNGEVSYPIAPEIQKLAGDIIVSAANLAIVSLNLRDPSVNEMKAWQARQLYAFAEAVKDTPLRSN